MVVSPFKQRLEEEIKQIIGEPSIANDSAKIMNPDTSLFSIGQTQRLFRRWTKSDL